MKDAEKAAGLNSAQRKRELQDRRLAELQGLTMEQWRQLHSQMTQARNLPKLAYHMRTHGDEFAALGVTDAHQLEALFLRHVKRSDLEYFTYISTKKGTQYRQWAMIAMDNGVVALYNESAQRHWSFMRPDDFEGYLAGNRGLWVRVQEARGKLKVQRWQP